MGENRRMMSEELLKIREGLDAPRPPSAARLAAEAFFSVPPPAVSDESETTVVVRRRQPVAIDHEMSAETPGEAEGQGDAGPRAPRVFRLESTALAAEAPPAPALEDPALEQGMPLVVDRPAVRRLPRKKARRLHGDVTIIRPVQEVTRQGSAAEMSAHAGPQIEPASLPVQPQSGRTADQMDDGWPHYPKLVTRIRELEAEAEVLKQLEAAEAIQWIRQAIATYGLTPGDFGFGDHGGR